MGSKVSCTVGDSDCDFFPIMAAMTVLTLQFALFLSGTEKQMLVAWKTTLLILKGVI